MATCVAKYIFAGQSDNFKHLTISCRFIQTLLKMEASNFPPKWSSPKSYACHRSSWTKEPSRMYKEKYTVINYGTLAVMVNCKRLKSDVSKRTYRVDPTENTGDVNTTENNKERDLEQKIGQQTSLETFGDHRVAYGEKSTFELLRALSFFFFCRFAFITENSAQIMSYCYKVLGKRLAEWFIRKLVYDQFVAGEGPQEVKRAAIKLRQGDVASILCVPMETDDHVDNSPSSSRDQLLDANLEKVLTSIELCTLLGNTFPMTQFRISALLAGDLTKCISRFCGDTTHDPKVLSALTEAMFGHHVNFCQLPGWKNFPKNRNQEFAAGLQRLGKVKDALEDRDVIVLIDAEYTSINPALRLLALCLMTVCNKEYAKIFYTYQAYLKATKANLEQDLAYASANSFGFGLKLVRGAYLVTERQLARDLGYDDPVNETFEDTSASYHDCLDLLLEQIAVRPPRSVRLMVASHNEETMRYTMARMKAMGVPKDGPSVFFGQLYGMADHVSFTLGRHGYHVYKSIPFGPVLETLPYLARRAQENKAILANVRRERKLVAKALADRIMFKF